MKAMHIANTSASDGRSAIRAMTVRPKKRRVIKKKPLDESGFEVETHGKSAGSVPTPTNVSGRFAVSK
jgi:hypothetical protein